MFVISHSFAVTPHFLMCASKIVPVHSKKVYIPQDQEETEGGNALKLKGAPIKSYLSGTMKGGRYV